MSSELLFSFRKHAATAETYSGRQEQISTLLITVCACNYNSTILGETTKEKKKRLMMSSEIMFRKHFTTAETCSGRQEQILPC